MRRAFSHLLLAGLASGVVAVACTPPAPFKATDISAVEWGGDFELTTHSGKRASTSEYRGKVLVLYFGYTHCPDICAPTLKRLAEVMKRLGPDAARVQVLFVTVDPRHDTAQQLASFVPRFHPAFVGMTGSEAEIAAVARDYRVAFQASPQAEAGRTLIDHFGGILVKDATGKLRLMVRNDAAVDDIVHDLRGLLAQKN